MIPYFITIAVAGVYALIRAKHDAFISHGGWKVWAFIEGVLMDLIVTAMIVLLFKMRWWMGIPTAGIFAFFFWLVFDCAEGYLRTGFILHLGDKGFDLTMRQMFHYNKPIFGWKETGAIRQVFFKCFWLVLLSGAYFSLL